MLVILFSLDLSHVAIEQIFKEWFVLYFYWRFDKQDFFCFFVTFFAEAGSRAVLKFRLRLYKKRPAPIGCGSTTMFLLKQVCCGSDPVGSVYFFTDFLQAYLDIQISDFFETLVELDCLHVPAGDI